MSATAPHEVTISSELEAELQALGAQGAAWGVPVTIDQNMVDAFTTMTGDENPIHRADAPDGPIVPGFLSLAMLPKLASFSAVKRINGLNVFNKEISDCDFKRPIPVGSTIRLRFQLSERWIDRMGVHVFFGFTIGLEPEMRAVVIGEIGLLLVG
jgi:acyl dehydratase